jgi:hypothetical protein
MSRSFAVMIGALLVMPAQASGQEQGGFAITRGGDTVAMETFTREEMELRGKLVRTAGPAARERVRYRAALLDDQSAPLVDLSVWLVDDSEASPARQAARIIFRDDSVAVDDVRQHGVTTRVFGTEAAALAYLNLSTAFLEQATRRAAREHRDSIAVPFFNLGGGQTVTGTVRALGRDSVSLRIGSVEFRLLTDAEGRILGGTVPSQGLIIFRSQGLATAP